MKIIGDRKRFAFAYSLDAQSGAEWMFGRCCYLVAGIEVGDFSLGVSLRDVYIQMTSIVKDNGNRFDSRLCGFDESKVFELLQYELYEASNDEITGIGSVIATPARFDVRIPVDVFDYCSMFLVDCEEQSKLIYSVDDKEVSVVSLQIGEFDDVMTTVFNDFGEMYDLAIKE